MPNPPFSRLLHLDSQWIIGDLGGNLSIMKDESLSSLPRYYWSLPAILIPSGTHGSYVPIRNISSIKRFEPQDDYEYILLKKCTIDKYTILCGYGLRSRTWIVGPNYYGKEVQDSTNDKFSAKAMVVCICGERFRVNNYREFCCPMCGRNQGRAVMVWRYRKE